MKLLYIIKSARLKTLPLAISGVLITSKIAYINNIFSKEIFIFYLITAILLQILSNFANDYGDGIKGTDKLRQDRVIGNKNMSASKMKIIIIITSSLALISGIYLSYISFPNNFIWIILFSLLGIFSIISAIKYTIGKNAYGYYGMGDLFVFIFFGLVSVIGGYFLFAKNFNYELIFPTITIGLFSVGVLNLNNLRDYKNDKLSNKNTLVVKIGYKKGVIYHFCLILLGYISILFYNYFLSNKLLSIIVIGLLLSSHLIKVYRGKDINKELKYLSIITLIYSIL